MKIYMLGIGGVSMSALAVMLKEFGHEVSGWDERFGRGVEILQAHGVEVDLPCGCGKGEKSEKNADLCVKNETKQDACDADEIINEENIENQTKGIKNDVKCPKNEFFGLKKLWEADLVVRSSAIKDNDFHMILAQKLGKKVVSRGEMLGKISENFEKVIAVAGSHGKTTTTAMIYNILCVAGLEPTLHLGGFKIDDGMNFALGEKEFFVTEACEYHDNFLFLKPYISVITNIEPEHLDFFGTFENEQKSFQKFRENSQIVVENFDGIYVKNIRHDRFGGLTFSLWREKEKIMDLHLHICEEVNTQNCIYAYLAAKKLGISDCFIKQGLEDFKGVGTRFERKKCPFFDNVICDYAHHPTEIAKAIASAKKIFKNNPLVTIFQPHTYSRTKTLLPKFLEVFEDLECSIFFKTYSARETESDGISAKQLAEILQKNGKNAYYFDNFADLKHFLEQFSKNTVLLFVGAGDLPQILECERFID